MPSITVLLRAESDRFGGTPGIQAHNVAARTVSAPAPPGAGVDRPALAPQSRRPTPTGIPTGRGGGRLPLWLVAQEYRRHHLGYDTPAATLAKTVALLG